MRRRFWLSSSSIDALLTTSRRRFNDAAVAGTRGGLAAAARGLCVFLCSRGWVSLRGDGGRQYVGEIEEIEWPHSEAPIVVSVETTPEYEARASERVPIKTGVRRGRMDPVAENNPLRGRQDADAVEEERRQRREAVGYTSAGYGMARIHAETAQRMWPVAASDTVQPGQLVYATSDGTVTATPSRHLPIAGTLLSYDGEGGRCVVAVGGGGSITMQLDATATASDAAAALRQAGVDAVATGSAISTMLQSEDMEADPAYVSPARCFIEFGAAFGQGLFRGMRTAAETTHHVDVAETRGTSSLLLGRTLGGSAAWYDTQWVPSTFSFTCAGIRQTVHQFILYNFGFDAQVTVSSDEPGQIRVNVEEDYLVEAVARMLHQIKPITAHIDVVGATYQVDADSIYLRVNDLSSSRLHDGVRVAAPATATVRLTNTSSETYTIAPGVLAVSSVAGSPTTWVNSDTITLQPGVVAVSVHSLQQTNDIEAPLSHIVRPVLPGVEVSQVSIQQPLPAPRTYIVDAVEVAPALASSPWMARLLPWLGSEVVSDDAELRQLARDCVSGEAVLVYVEERRALRVGTTGQLGDGVVAI